MLSLVQNIRFLFQTPTHFLLEIFIIIFIMVKKYCSLFILSLLLVLLTLARTQTCMSDNCLQCVNPYVCDTCQVAQNCCQQSCLLCIDQTKCQYCEFGYILNTNTSLCQLQQSCIQLSCRTCQNSVCIKCLEGFALDQITNECILCPRDCALCTPNGTCLQCFPYFYLHNGTCQNCQLSSCVECINTIVCVKCQIGHIIAQDTSQCIRCPGNCQYCAVSTACLACMPGYYLTSAGRCKRCSSTCQSCWGAANNCTQCNADSYNVQGQCYLCYKTVPMCVSCSYNSNQVICLNCAVQMYLSNNNTCLPCPIGCTTCSNSTNCLTCVPAYYLNGTCLPCNISNCIKCNNSTSCAICVLNYYFGPQNSSCLPCSPSCLLCNEPTICLNCQPGYALISNSTCVACPINCAYCSTKTLVCILCLSGFYMQNRLGICVPCSQYCGDCVSVIACAFCYPGAYQPPGTNYCLECSVQNCYNCNATAANPIPGNSCSLCFNGYYLSDEMDQCIPCQENCLICSNNTYCQVCMDEYYNQKGVCSPCSNHCQVCSGDGSVCIQCAIGYYMNYDNGSCSACPAGCLMCFSVNMCSSCNDGYFIIAPTDSSLIQFCLQCPSICLTCINQQVCTSCILGYHLLAGNCTQCPPGYQMCDKNYLVRCLQGHTLTVQKQDNQLIQNCTACPNFCQKCQQLLNVNSTIINVECTKCQVGFILLNSNNCMKCGSTVDTFGCQQCSSEGLCTLCHEGYSFSEDQTCILIQQNNDVNDWAYIGADIGLLCLFMILLIIALYQKLSTPTRSSGFDYQLITAN